MYKRNEGLTDNDILQNQFTTFLSTALCNHRKTYLRGIYRCRWRECVTDEIRSVCIEEEYYIEPGADYSELYAALHSIKEKERRVFLARVLDEKGFDEIAEGLGLSYKGAAAIYYRTIAKLRKLLGGDEG